MFVYAFFRFTWCMRQYSVGVLLVAAAPESPAFADEAQRQAFADRAGRVMGIAAETFNDGSVRTTCRSRSWPGSCRRGRCIAATAGVLGVLYRREYRSELLKVLEAG